MKNNAILAEGEIAIPMISPKPSGKQGKLAKSGAYNLLEKFYNHETAVLLFANHYHIFIYQYGAEHGLRIAWFKNSKG